MGAVSLSPLTTPRLEGSRQCLETLPVVTGGSKGVAPGFQRLETRVASKDPTMYRTVLLYKGLDKRGISLTVSGQKIFGGNAL